MSPSSYTLIRSLALHDRNAESLTSTHNRGPVRATKLLGLPCHLAAQPTLLFLRDEACNHSFPPTTCNQDENGSFNGERYGEETDPINQYHSAPYHLPVVCRSWCGMMMVSYHIVSHHHHRLRFCFRSIVHTCQVARDDTLLCVVHYFSYRTRTG